MRPSTLLFARLLVGNRHELGNSKRGGGGREGRGRKVGRVAGLLLAFLGMVLLTFCQHGSFSSFLPFTCLPRILKQVCYSRKAFLTTQTNRLVVVKEGRKAGRGGGGKAAEGGKRDPPKHTTLAPCLQPLQSWLAVNHLSWLRGLCLVDVDLHSSGYLTCDKQSFVLLLNLESDSRLMSCSRKKIK